MSGSTVVRFPAHRFISQIEFDTYCSENETDLDARYAWERSLASTAPTITREGTCAPCLRAATFTSRTAGGDGLAGGARLPNWREELTCDCEDALGARARALLHYIESVAAAQPWTRGLLFGGPTGADRRIAALIGGIRRIERLDDAHRLAAEPASVDLVVSADVLQFVPPLDVALAEVRRVLSPGGQFAFTVPFHTRAARTRSALDRLPRVAGRLPAQVGAACHEIGWDILPRLREAGFAQASAYVYWSRELGYYGPFNIIFGAVA